MVAAATSTSSIARMRSSDSTTVEPTGTPPPARPVIPPWGVTLMSWSWQNFSTSDTSAVERG